MLLPRLTVFLFTLAIGATALAADVNEPAPAESENLITLNVRDTPLGQVLEMISVQQRVNIVAGANTQLNITANLFDATLEEALDWLLLPNGMDWRFDGRVYYVASAEAFAAQELPPLEQRIFRPDYMSAAEVERMIVPMLSARGRVIVSTAPQTGIPTGEDETGGIEPVQRETLVVIDETEVLEGIAGYIDELDQPPRQVLVEATILEVRLDENNRFGVDFAFLENFDFSDVSNLDSFKSLFSPADGLLGDGAAAQTSGFQDPAGDGLQIGYVNDNVAVFLDALSAVTDTNVLANTKVLALNKMRGEIIIGGRLGYNAGTTVSDGISQQNVEFLEVGTQLRFRPYIGRDGLVRLEIHPERSSGIVNPDTGLPEENTSEVTTNVMMQDGQTIVIGGLIETTDVVETKKVPVLGYIPVVGWLFSSEETSVTRSEIVVMLTLHVLEHGEQVRGEQIIADAHRDREELRDTYGPVARVEHGDRTLDSAREAYDAGNLWEARLLCDRALMIDALADGAIDLSKEIDAAIEQAKLNGTWDEYEVEK